MQFLKSISCAILVLSAVAATPAFAELVPTPVMGDARLVTFDFDPDNTYLILTKPRAVTHLEFPPNEQIVTIASGDTNNWEATPTKNMRHIFVKARIENSSTTMTVITDKRSYQFIVKATSDGQKWYQRVTWRIPQTLIVDQGVDTPVEQKTEGPEQASSGSPVIDQGPQVDPSKLNFSYAIDGEAAFKPTSVFDDGKFTWLRMPSGLQELPVLFALDESGEYMLINYVTKGDFLVAQRTAGRMVLKLGKQQLTISKKVKEKTSWFGLRREDSQYGH